MTEKEKNRKLKVLTDDIKIFQDIVDKNPNDKLSKDILFFKKKQLDELEKTLTFEDLENQRLFNDVLKKQEEIVTSVSTSENKRIKDLRICFNSEIPRWDVVYKINDEVKKRYYSYNDLFIKNSTEAYDKMLKKYGDKAFREYDSIIYGILSELDVDLGTKLIKELLNNNNTFTVLYDFRNIKKLSLISRIKIKQSYKKNKSKEKVYMINSNTESDINFYNSIMNLDENKQKAEEVKPIMPHINTVKEEISKDTEIKETEENKVLDVKKANEENKSKVVPIDSSQLFDIKPIKEESSKKVEKEETIEKKSNDNNNSEISDLSELKDQLNKLKNVDFSEYESEKIEVLDENNLSLNEIFADSDIEVLDELEDNNTRKVA